ncbi:MAG: hypothetical protein G01um101433_1112 [Parcubacteria group bacterium Gr01-1014_33]|nr:MAG: hypothetical protein G01um101433_1112 [Parcubacteria group bacterium Gr01-1014_33]
MLQPKEITPITIFKSAHTRSKAFLSQGKENKTIRDADDLRAAVVFAVSLMDAYFRSKIIYILRKKNQSLDRKWFPDAVKKPIQKMIARELFNKDSQLLPRQREAIDAVYNSGKPTLITYLQKYLEDFSFQNIERLDEGMKMMGAKPQEIWEKVNQGKIKDVKPQKNIGRPKKRKKGRKTDIKIQLRNLFSKRHRIVHDADLDIHGKKSRGQALSISYTTVKKWIDSTETMINHLDSIIR